MELRPHIDWAGVEQGFDLVEVTFDGERHLLTRPGR